MFSPSLPLYDYEVSRTQNDRLKARVTTDFASVANLEAYQAYNENLLSEVLRTKKVDEPIFVSITFERPLSTDRARELTGVTQMDVLSYGVFGSKDNEVISTYISPSSHDIEGVPHSDRLMGVTYDGIMNVQGIVNVHGLDKLSASMGDIALIDLTANEIQANVGKATGEHIELEQIAVPSPAWQFYTGSRH